MSKRVEGRSYGQRVPPLTSVIKSILERYPDGGQILKEIIQNADDASATTISFLLDSRGSPYGKSSLYNDKLAKFQGPALYSFNSARFEQEDWDGLQSLMDSNKKEEPLKVGRFGIGFNSIYHVTDLPSVVSGQLLAFLDPHEEYFGKKETGQQFDLREPLIQNYEDQFSPFEDVLGCKISSQLLNGTLFRFPLRTEASKLSQKPYTTDKVRHLFQSLKDEASLILLFLKNIEEINLYETDENQREKLVFRVRLHDCCRERVREQRKNLLLQVPDWESGRQTVLQLDLEMVIEIFDTTTGTKQEKWITHNRIGDKQAKMRERALNLHLLPWVGFAAPLSVAGGSSIGSNGGRIFCFLPLPPDADAKTGYPVHIHGYFGLTDNRRGLKWPGPECQNDDMAEWNVDLMRYVGSRAYASLLQSMTTCLPSDMISIFYQCWPDKQYVNKYWNDIIDKVYKLLLSKRVFWTTSSGGRWLSLNEAVLERFRRENLSAGTKTVVKKVLHLANEPVVSLPLHVDEYVRKKMSGTCLVTPKYLRAILKQNRKKSWDMEKMSREERIAMLEYIVTDNNFADFEGIALLPLADGLFTTFKAGKRCGPNDVVYVETPDNRRTLLPGTESRFLDPNINSLSRMAVEQNNYCRSPLQLVRLNPQTVVSLLWQILPNEMLNLPDPVVWTPSSGNHPSEAWLADMWNWLKQKFPYNLSQLEGLPIIKCSLGQHTALTKLRTNTKTIRQKSYQTGMPLPQDLVSILKKAGVVVLPEVPYYMMQHACFSTYVADASPEGVLKVLRNIGIQSSTAAVTASNAQERQSLRVFLSSLRANLSNDERQFLKSLPIFEAINQTSFIDAQNKSSTAPRGFAREITLKIKNASCILSVEDDASNQLLKVLNIPEMTMGQFLTREVFPHLSCYTTQEVTSLMCWVLRRIDVFRCEPNFCTHLSSLNFVDAGQGSLAKPQDLFDPRNQLNKRLLEGEESKFPVGEFAKDDILVPLRNHLGLKETLDHVDVANLAMNLHRFDINQRRRKAMALLEFLEKFFSLLTRNVNVGGGYQMLQDVFRNVAWVPCAKDPPLGYPRCMPWKSDGNGLLTPQQVVASKYGVVVGSVMSVLQSESTISIKSVFGWDKGPDGSKVLEQLRIACNEIDVKSLQGNEREQFWRMLKSIYETLAVNDYCYNLFQADFAWIWNGQGFSSPSKIAFRRQTNFDLEPYLHTIPKEMQEEVLCDFFPKFGVMACFADEDLLDVLLDIKAKHDNANAKLDRDVIDKDKQLALDILHWIVREGPLNPDLRDKVYVPVMKGPGILNLVPLSKCTFCDAAWLRGNFQELQMLPELSDLSMIDESISNTTASHLGVPPMSRCVTAPEALVFEQAGPYEPITRRLKNILDEYKEGAGVFKELIQNADDAGATEVKFLVDWRQHPAKKLLAEGMKDSQGPALLAYNNAVFTKKDFENINKLAGATKKEDLDKIGRFGLGFNSVYHFTDTPSFVSSNYAVFFDPDTKHLGNFITNPSHPGIKLNLAVNKNTFLYCPDQFQPYQGVFECDVKSNMPFNFDGTLFRFPFRRGPSEICDKQYNERDVKALLESFNRKASSLLLNTQNVQHVSVWELDRAKEASDVKLLTKVERKILSDSGGSNMTTFLHECATWSSNRDLHLPQRTKIISITQTMTEDEQKARTEYWLQCDRLGDAESLEMATSEEGRQKGLLSCAGVAVNLNKSKGSWKVKCTDGEAFCFLPLSIPTGLPVHVNGYFAVTSNRRGIWEQTAEESQYFQPIEARWNKALMKDGIAQAYVELLKETKRMAQKGDLQEYNFCSLWPNPDSLQSHAWNSLIVGVYTLIASSSLPLLKSGGKWYSIEDCFFPDNDVQRIPASLRILQELDYKIVDLPHFARRGFSMAECGEQIENQTMSEKKFLEDVFFPNIKAITGELRDKVVCYVIDGCLAGSNEPKKTLFQELLSTHACIPCSADQQVLARPRDLIHPLGAAASLYSPCDNKLPVGDCFLEEKRLLVLEHLGMIKNILNWDQICDRALSVQSLNYDSGLKRVSNLIKYLNEYITDMSSVDDDMNQFLTTLPIFPVMPKPKSQFFPWEGERNGPKAMLSSNKLFGKEFSNIIGSLKPILDESEETGCGKLKPKVEKLFQISDHQPEVEEALTQLQTVCEHFQETGNCTPLQNVTTGICNEIYAFLHSHISNEDDLELMKCTLQESSWLFMEDRFVKSNQVAFEWDGYGVPYLYRVPRSLAVSYRELLEEIGIKRTFHVQDFLLALNEMSTEKVDQRLNDAEFKVSKEFLDELNKLLDKIPEEAFGCTPMPDQDRILRPTQDLVINDAPWILMDQEVKYVHVDISINLAHSLGTRDIRSKNLEDISRSIGHAFGQKELLTDRLANILKSYPCDFGILKELLQNADDAKATEIHFVYDPRQLGKERLFKDSWKELQGPALCVYNNRPFSEKDLEGIQRLGIGSKADSPEKTGQYGIGFNAVYHLTDCPSFITDGNTLCILDPHARYAPGATKDNPGRLIGPFEKTANFQENYRDVLPGYLGDMFDLKGSTMFRFPLRNEDMASKSDISQKEALSQIKYLLRNFMTEAKETLLFLNYVKKISISEIEGDKLKRMYEVSADLKEEDETKRSELAAHVKKSKHLPTSEIERFGIFYPITLKDNSSEEKWLVHQTIGVSSQESNVEIPDGKHNGLLPRAGVAAKVASQTELRLINISSYPERRKAFCFLPLPVITGLPLHVNGHFALDSGRRHLWQDEDKGGFRSKWNQFMKTEVIADAYTSLLVEARGHIPYLKREEQLYFNHAYEGNYGLQWYQGLFPSQEQSESQWQELVIAVLNKITHSDENVLPLLRKVKAEEGFKHICSWLSPSEGFFPNLDCGRMLPDILRNIGFNLVSLQYRICENFRKANSPVKEVAPEPVLKFLSSHEPILEQLPCPIGDSSMESAADVIHLIEYCLKSPSFVKNLHGVPLLLTRDGVLRVFSKMHPVYLSKFSYLIESSAHHERFAAKDIVTALQLVFEDLFHQSPPVALPLNLSNLVKFFPSIFKEHEVWSQSSIPVSWNPDGKDREIKKWLTNLWLFISKKHKENPSDRFLEPLGPWPVIPTTSGYLLPVSLSKTVLDLTKLDSWSNNQRSIVQALRKLLCPEVDMELMKLKGASVSDVVKTYLAYPNSVNDVITVLESLMEREHDISGRIDADTASLLLHFLKEDPQTLQSNARNVPVLRKLPFYKTIDGQLIKLEGASSVCKVSPGIPLVESSLWMEGTRNIFLEPCQSLDVLHKMLGVELKSHVSCYIDFIFPKFSHLQESTRLTHLLYIRDCLLHMINGEEVARLESALKKLRFIPNDSGELHKASYYYDPRKPVFKAMLSKSKFPCKPFCETKWVEFLCRIGLQTTITKDQFLAFAREIEKEAEQNVTSALLKKSEVLTRYLLEESGLEEANFLAKVSTIKFVAAYEAEEKFNSLVKQYLFEKSFAPFISFRNALPRTYEILVWGSAALLPEWAWPSEMHIRRSLGILEKPTLQQVKNHVQRLCSKFDSKDIDLEKSVRKLLLQIMSETYSFLQNSLKDLNVHQFFHGVPLVLVEDGRVFIRCEQLAFEMAKYEEQPPYLYKVPREFGQFDSLFKHLGAFEKPCPTQYAYILQTLWKDSKGEELHPEEMRHVKNAVRSLFRTLKRLHKDDERAKPTKCLNSLQDIETLYLPTDKKHLKPSNLLYYVSPHLLSRIDKEEFTYDLLYDLMDCGLLNDRAEDLLGYLPPHLQVTPLTNILVEELHADCFDRKCKMDESGKCSNADRLRLLLNSHHLIDGIIRILKFQNRSMKVDDELRQKVESLRTVFIVVCFESLETVLKNDKDEEARGSKVSKSYFAKEDGTKTCIFIQHGARGIYSNVSYKLSLAVNKHIGNAVNQEHFAHLESIILYGIIRRPTEIHSTLDNRGIEPDKEELTNDDSETSSLGSLIPEELHYLLVQFEDILFRPEEIVGYEKSEEDENSEKEQGEYCYARIVRETSAPNLGGRTKKPKRDPTTGRRKTHNSLLRKYLIDIGTGQNIEVDALDLYKLKRPEELTDSNDNTTDNEMSDSQAVVPYEGKEQSTGADATTKNSRPDLPRTLEKAKKEVDKALADIMKLPKEQRKKAVKRLFLRWHPDKNPDMEELATEVMKYIQNEFQRLSEGRARDTSQRDYDAEEWESSFRKWDQRARRQRASYDNYRRSNPGFTRNFSSAGGHRNADPGQSYYGFGPSGSSASSTPFGKRRNSYHAPDAKLARIWLIQSRSDLESVKHLFSAKTPGGFYWLICFQCNQVVEKALKAALYSVSGISNSQLDSHDLTSLAYYLKRLPRAPDIVHSVGKLWSYHDATRYPNKHDPAKPPKEVYTFQQAQEAYDIAKSVLKTLEEFIGILHL